MMDRPGPLGQLDGYFAAARIAHEYVADMHRELVELDAAGDHTRELLRESAGVVFERMPGLTSRLRRLERKWTEQELLNRRQPNGRSSGWKSNSRSLFRRLRRFAPDRMRLPPRCSTSSAEHASGSVPHADRRAAAVCS